MPDFQSQPNYPGANPEEIATLIVGGYRFTDWETVWVQHRWNDNTPLFRLTAAERDPILDYDGNRVELWSKLQFLPGTSVRIYLAGKLAIIGYILVRQVAYDANSHGISLQGVGDTYYATTASITPEQSKMEYDGGLMEIARKLMAPTGVPVEEVGAVDGTPFKPPVHFTPGTTIWDALSDLARHRDAKLSGSDRGILEIIGKDPPSISGLLLKEGLNIKSAQITIDAQHMRSKIMSSGQSTGNNEKSGRQSSEMEAIIQGQLERYRPIYVPYEHPVWTQHEVELRATHEDRYAGMHIYADITTTGWLTRPGSGLLWPVGSKVRVDTPMGPLNDDLSIEVATFQQDSSEGTRTTLHCIEPWRNMQDGGLFTKPVGADGKPAVATSSDAPHTPPPNVEPNPLPPDTLEE